MKRFKLVMLLAVLLLGACQENSVEKLNPDNQNSQSKERLWMVRNVEGVATRAVALKEKLWNSGDTIKIKFLNGSSDLQNKVKLYANKWLKYACLYFEYVSGDSLADVKIGFDMVEKELAWSTIGTDCKLIPQDEPSTHFVYLDDPDEEFIRGEVLRAFGHILGLGFEHQNPDSPILFKDNAQDWLTSNYGLTESEAIDIMAQYGVDQTNYTEYDKNSIMVVELSSRILGNRSDATTFNTELSGNDTTFISQSYPSSVPENPEFDAQLNIDALNAYVDSIDMPVFHLIIGINYDNNEKLPFVATDKVGTDWIGYVSKGKVYIRRYLYDVYHNPYWFEYRRFVSFIYDNELYTSLLVDPDSYWKTILTINTLDSTVSERLMLPVQGDLRLPFTLNGKTYIGGIFTCSNQVYGESSFYSYNLTDNCTGIQNVFPYLAEGVNPPYSIYVDNGYLYYGSSIIDSALEGTNLFYRLKIDNLEPELIGQYKYKDDFGRVVHDIPIMINGNFYVALFDGQIIDIEDNNRSIYSNFNNNNYTIGYGNRLFFSTQDNDKSHYFVVDDFE